MRRIPTHPQKHLIRDLWPDKHLYASTMLLLSAAIGAAFALVARLVPVTLARDMPTDVAGWNWPFGVVLPAIVAALAIAAYRTRKPWLGLVGALVGFGSFGALGVSSLLAAGSVVFFVLARREGEHANPATRALRPRHWPDKALTAALLLAVAAIGSLVWGGMLLSGWLDVRSLDLTWWGIGALVVAVLATVGATFAYWQRTMWVPVVASLAVVLSLGFVVVGPALGLGAAWLLVRAHKEREFHRL